MQAALKNQKKLKIRQTFGNFRQTFWRDTIPQQQTGTEYTDISRETTMTPQAWKAKVAAGDWFIYAEPKVTFDAAMNMYELHIKKTPCR